MGVGVDRLSALRPHMPLHLMILSDTDHTYRSISITNYTVLQLLLGVENNQQSVGAVSPPTRLRTSAQHTAVQQPCVTICTLHHHARPVAPRTSDSTLTPDLHGPYPSLYTERTLSYESGHRGWTPHTCTAAPHGIPSQTCLRGGTRREVGRKDAFEHACVRVRRGREEGALPSGTSLCVCVRVCVWRMRGAISRTNTTHKHHAPEQRS